MKKSDLKEALRKLITMCYEISNKTVTDAFMAYSPHINTFDVYVYPDGWKKNKAPIYIAFTEECTVENIEKAINELEGYL